MYRKIMLASDGSDHSLRSADQAAFIANMSSAAEVHIVYVIDEDTLKSEVLQNWNHDDIDYARRKKLKPVVDKIRFAGIHYELIFLIGDPSSEIVQYCNDNSFDLAVIGSKGHSALQEMVLGSVSFKVAKRVNCPVLIVK